MSYKDDKELIRNAVRLYETGLTQKEVSEILGCSESCVLKILRYEGVPKRGKAFYSKILSESEEKEVVQKYLSGKAITQIAKEYNCSAHPIKNALDLYGVTARDVSHSHQRYSLNENYFDVIDTQDKAYILGFLYADGCNTINEKKYRFRVSITLKESDRRLLEEINKALDSNSPIEELYVRGKQYVRVGYSNKHMGVRLMELGLVPNKSLIVEFPVWLNGDLIPHFIRGVFDGDGSISTKLGYVNLIGSDKLIKSVKELLESMDIHCKTYEAKNPKTLQLFINKPEYKCRFLNWIYKDAHIKLKRKYDLYLKMLDKYDIKLAG